MWSFHFVVPEALNSCPLQKKFKIEENAIFFRNLDLYLETL